jgi:hypothetical protein
VSGDNQTGVFKLAKKVAEASAPAPQSSANDTAAGLRLGFSEVSGWVTKAADLVPADKYSYRPVPTVRTFGQQLAHIAVAYNYYCARAVGQNVPWSDALEKGNTDKATLAARSPLVETILHPIPSVQSRLQQLAAQGGEPRGAWQAARVALFLSWGCFGFLSRTVHCNSGRPEL